MMSWLRDRPSPVPSPARLGRKERVEHLLLHFGRDAGAVVADPDLHPVAEVLGRGRKGWLIATVTSFGLALGRSIEAVRDQIEQHPGDLLGEHVDLASGRIE